MIKWDYFFEKIKDVKIKDYLAVFSMIAALLVQPFYKKKFKNLWLICEEPLEARDNGYQFFRYMRQYQPQQPCIYAIKKNSVDYKKVKKLGQIIEYGSVLHWVAYFLCQYNISSQKGGKPNAAICSFMELNGIFKPCNIFLQHGIIINDLRWLYADRSKIDLFITSTIPERNFIVDKFGYPEDTICLTGMPRFDNLHNSKVNKKQVLIMPTWRYWFKLHSKKYQGSDNDFVTSEYYRKWTELLKSEKLELLIKTYQLEVIFYPHRNMQDTIDILKKINSQVKIASWKEYDIQKILKSAAVMITDYSSVFFDMVYMKKPVLFYQFDERKYREHQYGEGYFNYYNNPFGKAFDNLDFLLEELGRLAESDFSFSKEAEESHRTIFPYWDQKNSERIYNVLENRTKRESKVVGW